MPALCTAGTGETVSEDAAVEVTAEFPNGFRFLRQFNEYGLRGKINVVGGMTACDEAVLRNMGDEAIGVRTSCCYSAELASPINRKFAEAFRAEFKYDLGFYAAATYVNGSVGKSQC